MAQGGFFSLKGAGINDYLTVTKTGVTFNLTAIGTGQVDNVSVFDNTLARLNLPKADYTYTSAYDGVAGSFSVTFGNISTMAKFLNLLRLFRHFAIPANDITADLPTIVSKVAIAQGTHTDTLSLIALNPITVSTTNLVLKFDLTGIFAGYTAPQLDAVLDNWLQSLLGFKISSNTSFFTSAIATSYNVTLALTTVEYAQTAFKVFQAVNNPNTGVYGPSDLYSLFKTCATQLLV